jgi:class 3 adenylate cyclase
MNGATFTGRILVVDDNPDIRELLKTRLTQQGHSVGEAENGRLALEKLCAEAYDMMVLDITMPEMDGYQVLEHRKNNAALRDIPVVIVSAISDLESVVRCIELGADDYLPKPFKNAILRARVQMCLERKRLRDQERAYLRRIEEEQAKSETLLLNILPAPIAARLKDGETVIADNIPEVTVLFADLVNFSKWASTASPVTLVHTLNTIFSKFDELAEQSGLEKIKTIGDAYMAVAGLPGTRTDHAEAAADMALAMQSAIADVLTNESDPFYIRVGLHTGPVVAGVIGQKKFSYDLWGDTVNTASRMESHGLASCIQTSEATYLCLRDGYEFEERGTIAIKGKGEVPVYLLLARKPANR